MSNQISANHSSPLSFFDSPSSSLLLPNTHSPYILFSSIEQTLKFHFKTLNLNLHPPFSNFILHLHLKYQSYIQFRHAFWRRRIETKYDQIWSTQTLSSFYIHIWFSSLQLAISSTRGWITKTFTWKNKGTKVASSLSLRGNFTQFFQNHLYYLINKL